MGENTENSFGRGDDGGDSEYLVDWTGDDDPGMPQNWALRKRWTVTLSMSAFSLVASVSSSIVAPCLRSIAEEFRIGGDFEAQMVLSSFVLAWAVGPLFLGALSEMYGRILVLQACNLFFLVFNLAGGFARSKEQLIVFRVLSGLGASAPTAVCDGVVADLWREDERGLSISVYSLAPLLGPAIGPIAGGFIDQYVGWRWTFYATSIAAAVVSVSGVILTEETYGPVLLRRKAAELRRRLGNPRWTAKPQHGDDKSVAATVSATLARSFRMLGTQPVIQVLGLYMAYLFGIIYVLLSTFTTLWEEAYSQDVAVGGLHYLAIGVGLLLGTQVGARVNDRVFKKLKDGNGGVGLPEHRLPLLGPASLLIPVGLLVYGWPAQTRAPWIVPDIGVAIFTGASIVAFQCIQMYIIDTYPLYSASAMSAASLLRSSAGFAFPIFGPYLYQSMGYGWGNSVLALVSVVVGVPAVPLLWRYGALLRARSPFCSGANAAVGTVRPCASSEPGMGRVSKEVNASV
ncbi:mfs multidrug transporter [Diplodia corticola]|uniref:Mfs multidrug transporter n=1 Tax=Diplodia corticola TaxID=236234 RepID=A0A1J9RZT9_9PEZI|nr:mfs multidrug transporter [Diplodia corticola]OJD33863.1 mfs multidrug transporter [Diplodia corticola]